MCEVHGTAMASGHAGNSLSKLCFVLYKAPDSQHVSFISYKTISRVSSRIPKDLVAANAAVLVQQEFMIYYNTRIVEVQDAKVVCYRGGSVHREVFRRSFICRVTKEKLSRTR
jgi:hypothetical protein